MTSSSKGWFLFLLCNGTLLVDPGHWVSQTLFCKKRYIYHSTLKSYCVFPIISISYQHAYKTYLCYAVYSKNPKKSSFFVKKEDKKIVNLTQKTDLCKLMLKNRTVTLNPPFKRWAFTQTPIPAMRNDSEMQKWDAFCQNRTVILSTHRCVQPLINE